MKRIENSRNPKDIATLAYIWGYPLVQFERVKNFETNPNSSPAHGNGPINKYVAFTKLPSPGFTSGEYSNPDLLYAQAWLNLSKEPVILKIPEIKDRYHVFEFVDAYDNDFHYLGTRTTGEKGGIYPLEVRTGKVKFLERCKKSRAQQIVCYCYLAYQLKDLGICRM